VQLAYDGLEIEVSVARSAATQELRRPAADRNASLELFPSSEAWAKRHGASRCGSTLAIGNFDGIHLGHQAILGASVTRARTIGAVATVLTFDPTPQKVLRPESAPLRISTTEQRLDRFAAIGMDAAVVLPFTHDLARLSPQEFVDQILVQDLQVRTVFVGENFRFGHKQTGDARMLQELGAQRGFEVVVIPPVVHKSEVVSSTIIRREIAAGDVTHAAQLLGRPFVLSGKVVSGTGTGRRFTFPTLNLAPQQELLPARGVYVTRTLIAGESRTRRSVTNIGVRPTFNGSTLSVETHVLEPLGETSPKRIEVHFCKHLREEKKFRGPQELRAQIARDIASANKFFTRLRPARAARFSI
jgi:riboflavin kinase/FMN adenylyltransferase